MEQLVRNGTDLYADSQILVSPDESRMFEKCISMANSLRFKEDAVIQVRVCR